MNLNSYISVQFKNPAGVGGKAISFVMNRQNISLYEETIRLLAPINNDSILDIGCGNGFVLNMLANQNNCTFTGIDPSQSIIKNALKRCKRFVKTEKMFLSCQNVNSMNFADNSFSKAYTINTIYFWDNLSGIMSEIRRVLKPHGIFINTFYSGDTLSQFSHTQYGYKRFTVEELTTAGRNAGFEVNVIPILNGSAYCAIYRRTD